MENDKKKELELGRVTKESRQRLGHSQIEKDKKKEHEQNLKFGQVIKESRERLGISQYGLASKIPLDRSYISLLEMGKRSATLNTIVTLAKAFNVTPSQLIHKFEVTKLPKKTKAKKEKTVVE
jgi:ribosome-binding protein aMBF1 (putative translation factor)